MSNTLRLAIVGAGIAGSTAAETASNRIDDVTIDIFEKDHRVGGRMAAATVGSHTIEASALGFWDRYTYLTDYLDQLELERTTPFVFDGVEEDVNEAGPFIGVWDGEAFVTTVSKSLTGLLSVVRSYGLAPVRLWWQSKRASRAFETLHDLIEEGNVYESPSQLVTALDAEHVVDRSARAHFRSCGVTDDCIDELLEPMLRTIWGQGASMQSFVAALSVDAMADHEGMQSVVGGNVRLVERLLETVESTVYTETPVTAIVECEGGETYELETDDGTYGPYDAVVVATPLDTAPIEIALEGGSVPRSVTDEREFQTRHIVLVDGQLNPEYFGCSSRRELPMMITTTADGSAPFTSTVIAREIDEERTVYRINANDELDDAVLEELFTSITEIDRYTWEAFPVYDPPVAKPPFRIADGLYYVNAMESIVSTMETEIVGARNVVGLLERDLTS